MDRSSSLCPKRLFGLCVCLLLVAGCQSSGGEESADSSASQSDVKSTFSGSYPIGVVCTTGMVADVVRNVGGEHVDVTQLMGEGVDPHLFKPTPGDVSLLSGADVTFYSGLHLEGHLADVFSRMQSKKPTHAVTKQIDPAHLIQVEGELHDPHVWFDVSIWSEGIGLVAEVLSEFDPSHQDDYAAAADEYRAKLQTLDTECRERLAKIPEKQRVLVTAHDAFQYFGRAYGIEVRAIQGVSTESEAGLREMNELIGFIVENRIKAVFVETSVSDANIEALIAGCKAEGHTVEKGAALFSDAMGAEGTREGTYEGMIRHNVEAISKALR